MKKMCNRLLALVLTFGLVACGAAGGDWQAQYDLGVRYLSEGNYEEAVLAFEAAIEIDPKQETPYIGLADAYIGLGNFGRARQLLLDAQALLGDCPQIDTKLAQMDLLASLPKLTITNFSATYEDGPDPYNEGSVGTMWLSATVDAPTETQDMLIATWQPGGPFTQPQLMEHIHRMTGIWKEEGVPVFQREPGPLFFDQGFPVNAEERGTQVWVLLIGVDTNCNAVSYAVLPVSIP